MGAGGRTFHRRETFNGNLPAPRENRTSAVVFLVFRLAPISRSQCPLRRQISVRLWRAVVPLLTLIGVAGILICLVRWRPRHVLLASILIGCAVVIIAFVDGTFLGGLRPLDGGDDGMAYEGFGRAITRDLMAGHISEALRGSEDVYFFTPGLRYFQAVGHLIFGDTFLAYLSAMLAVPFLVVAAYRRFLPERWALTFVLLFVATPVGVLFGSSFLLYVKAASRGYADPLAFAAFLAGFVLIVPRGGRSGDQTVGHAFWGALLFAATVFTRPNLVLAVGVMLAGATVFAILQSKPRVVAALLLGFSPIVLSLLHNLAFGHSFVAFTSSMIRPETMRMFPWDYLFALGDLLRLDMHGAYLVRAIAQLTHWLSGPSESVLLVPLHLASIAVLVRVGLLRGQFDPWLRLTAIAALLQHGIGLCYIVYDRYHLLTWLLTCLVVLCWVRTEGLPFLQRRYPSLRDRWMRLPLVTQLNSLLAQMQSAVGLHPDREQSLA